ncbi:uncharacterized protein LAJ45_04720 [Morchella importuna]|uniref:uncharacterized protein n=1 Tax=Morchella importuna TaxID=1174673 RepID=UPI001E8E2F8A|nr:uncharacterized protein LAJ45_04720 [Morchella importuna]KAH8151019.1 hypothetical protein LAJ45_04720 [Morchella importuna]
MQSLSRSLAQGSMLAPPQAPEEIGIVYDAISPFLSMPTSGEKYAFLIHPSHTSCSTAAVILGNPAARPRLSPCHVEGRPSASWTSTRRTLWLGANIPWGLQGLEILAVNCDGSSL